MRKTQQLHLAGVVLLFPVTEDPLGHTVREERKNFNPLDNQTAASGLQPLLQRLYKHFSNISLSNID